MDTAKITRGTETRHSPTGKACHHFVYHRLTCDAYDELRARASGRCEMCATTEAETGGRRLVVDHFEGRGLWLIRGLLCDRCNAAMSCVDGMKRWGPRTLRLQQRAWAYEAKCLRRLPDEQQATMREVQARRAQRLTPNR